MSAADINWDQIRAEDSEVRGEAPYVPYAGPDDLQDFLRADAGEPDAATADGPTDRPDAGVITDKKQSIIAKRYEKKARGLLSTGFKLTVEHPATVADSAAILFYAPRVAKAAGDLADANPRARQVLDFLTEGSENAAAAMAIAAMPLMLQLIRNHEPVLEPQPRGIKIPFTQRRINIRWKFGIRLGNLRAMTNDPNVMMNTAFSDPEVMAVIQKQGINVATRGTGRRAR